MAEAAARCRTVGLPTSAINSATYLSPSASSRRRRTSARTAPCSNSDAGSRRFLTKSYNSSGRYTCILGIRLSIHPLNKVSKPGNSRRLSVSRPPSHNGTTGSSHQVVGYAPSYDARRAEPHGERSRSMGKNTRFIGLDVHAETIAVAVAEGRNLVRSLGTIANRPEAIRRLLGKLGRLTEQRIRLQLRSRAQRGFVCCKPKLACVRARGAQLTSRTSPAGVAVRSRGSASEGCRAAATVVRDRRFGLGRARSNRAYFRIDTRLETGRAFRRM